MHLFITLLFSLKIWALVFELPTLPCLSSLNFHCLLATLSFICLYYIMEKCYKTDRLIVPILKIRVCQVRRVGSFFKGGILLKCHIVPRVTFNFNQITPYWYIYLRTLIFFLGFKWERGQQRYHYCPAYSAKASNMNELRSPSYKKNLLRTDFEHFQSYTGWIFTLRSGSLGVPL